VQIERGSSNTLVVMARVTLSPSYWLLHFTDIERGGNAYCVVEPGNSGGAFISLTFTETSGAVALDGEVLLAPPGNWNVKIYEQTSSTNLVPASANRLVKDVDVFVVGDGVADGGWTETCPPDSGECDPLSVQVNGELYATIEDPCAGVASVEVVQGDVPVGELIDGQWVVPECDDLTITINKADDVIIVPNPCGENVVIAVTQDGFDVGSWNGTAWIVPECEDAEVTFDGLPVLTIPCGDTGSLDCGTTIDSAHVTLGSSSENGIYYISGTAGGKTLYKKNTSYVLEYSGTRWVMIRPGSDHQAALGNETYPWLADWTGTGIAVDQGTISQYCGGNAEPCADLTIAINGTTYGTVANPCGATAPVDVHDSNGNDVGSLVSGAWVVPSGPAPYVRPSDWLALPSVLSSDKKFVGLHAVFDNPSNFCAVQCTAAYTVDWGDGSAPVNYASNAFAYKNFVYGDIGSGTLSTRGYRQAIVTITPQAGQNLNKVDLYIKHNQSGLPNSYSSGWLDCKVAGSNLSTITVGNSGTVIRHNMLEQFEVVGTAPFSGTFGNCRALESVIGLNTSARNNFISMFSNCTSLKTVPLFSTVAAISLDSMFSSCISLQTVPLFNTALVTNFSNMFVQCSSLQTVPLFNTASGTNFTSMFSQCYSLKSVPLFNTASATNFNGMFIICTSLKTVPLFNTALVTNFSSMFFGCTALQSPPLFNTASGTTFANMFNDCASLQTVPLFNTAAGINFANMFNTCPALKKVAALNVSAASSAATQSTLFSALVSLSSAALSGTKFSVNYSNCALSAPALVNIFNGLATVVASSQTITITGNWGASILTAGERAIATGKGWLITG